MQFTIVCFDVVSEDEDEEKRTEYFVTSSFCGHYTVRIGVSVLIRFSVASLLALTINFDTVLVIEQQNLAFHTSMMSQFFYDYRVHILRI